MHFTKRQALRAQPARKAAKDAVAKDATLTAGTLAGFTRLTEGEIAAFTNACEREFAGRGFEEPVFYDFVPAAGAELATGIGE